MSGLSPYNALCNIFKNNESTTNGSSIHYHIKRKKHRKHVIKERSCVEVRSELPTTYDNSCQTQPLRDYGFDKVMSARRRNINQNSDSITGNTSLPDDNFNVLRKENVACPGEKPYEDSTSRSTKPIGQHLRHSQVNAIYHTVSDIKKILKTELNHHVPHDEKCLCDRCGTIAVVTESLKRPVQFESFLEEEEEECSDLSIRSHHHHHHRSKNRDENDVIVKLQDQLQKMDKRLRELEKNAFRNLPKLEDSETLGLRLDMYTQYSYENKCVSHSLSSSEVNLKRCGIPFFRSVKEKFVGVNKSSGHHILSRYSSESSFDTRNEDSFSNIGHDGFYYTAQHTIPQYKSKTKLESNLYMYKPNNKNHYNDVPEKDVPTNFNNKSQSKNLDKKIPKFNFNVFNEDETCEILFHLNKRNVKSTANPQSKFMKFFSHCKSNDPKSETKKQLVENETQTTETNFIPFNIRTIRNPQEQFQRTIIKHAPPILRSAKLLKRSYEEYQKEKYDISYVKKRNLSEYNDEVSNDMDRYLLRHGESRIMYLPPSKLIKYNKKKKHHKRIDPELDEIYEELERLYQNKSNSHSGNIDTSNNFKSSKTKHYKENIHRLNIPENLKQEINTHDKYKSLSPDYFFYNPKFFIHRSNSLKIITPTKLLLDREILEKRLLKFHYSSENFRRKRRKKFEPDVSEIIEEDLDSNDSFIPELTETQTLYSNKLYRTKDHSITVSDVTNITDEKPGISSYIREQILTDSKTHDTTPIQSQSLRYSHHEITTNDIESITLTTSNMNITSNQKSSKTTSNKNDKEQKNCTLASEVSNSTEQKTGNFPSSYEQTSGEYYNIMEKQEYSETNNYTTSYENDSESDGKLFVKNNRPILKVSNSKNSLLNYKEDEYKYILESLMDLKFKIELPNFVHNTNSEGSNIDKTDSYVNDNKKIRRSKIPKSVTNTTSNKKKSKSLSPPRGKTEIINRSNSQSILNTIKQGKKKDNCSMQNVQPTRIKNGNVTYSNILAKNKRIEFDNKTKVFENNVPKMTKPEIKNKNNKNDGYAKKINKEMLQEKEPTKKILKSSLKKKSDEKTATNEKRCVKFNDIPNIKKISLIPKINNKIKNSKQFRNSAKNNEKNTCSKSCPMIEKVSSSLVNELFKNNSRRTQINVNDYIKLKTNFEKDNRLVTRKNSRIPIPSISNKLRNVSVNNGNLNKFINNASSKIPVYKCFENDNEPEKDGVENFKTNEINFVEFDSSAENSNSESVLREVKKFYLERNSFDVERPIKQNEEEEIETLTENEDRRIQLYNGNKNCLLSIQTNILDSYNSVITGNYESNIEIIPRLMVCGNLLEPNDIPLLLRDQHYFTNNNSHGELKLLPIVLKKTVLAPSTRSLDIIPSIHTQNDSKISLKQDLETTVPSKESLNILQIFKSESKPTVESEIHLDEYVLKDKRKKKNWFKKVGKKMKTLFKKT